MYAHTRNLFVLPAPRPPTLQYVPDGYAISYHSPPLYFYKTYPLALPTLPQESVKFDSPLDATFKLDGVESEG